MFSSIFELDISWYSLSLEDYSGSSELESLSNFGGC